MKVAVAAESKEEVERLKEVLDKSYEIRSIDENERDGLFTAMITMTNSKWRQIEKCLSLLEVISGINPREKNKSFVAVKVRRAAAYLLYNRFGLSHDKIAQMLNYKSHASSKIFCDELGAIEVDIDTVPIEVAIRRVLNYEKQETDRDD